MIVQQIINGTALGAVYSLIAIGFALIFSILKFPNFSHGGVLTVTAYVGFLIGTNLNTNIWVTLILTAVAGGLLAVIIELIAFRRLRIKKSPILFYFVSSITMGMLLENLITIYFSSNFYSYPKFFSSVLRFNNLHIGVSDLLMLTISSFIVFVLIIILRYTRLGVAIRALSVDVNTTSLMGVNVNLIIAATFFVSGALGGISGVFLGIKYTLYPQIGQLIVKGFIATVIGGLGSIFGAVAGAIILGILEVVSISIIGSGLSPVVLFVVMVVFLLIRPQGISGYITEDRA